MRIVAACLACVLPCFAQEPEAPLDAALAVLRSAQTLDDEAVGDGGEKTETYRAYEVLRERAARDWLLALTRHARPIVRCYALRALVERHGEVDLLPVLLAHTGDVQEVETFVGCTLAREKVGDVMIDTAWQRLSKSQRLALAERLIVEDSELYARERALRTMSLPERLLHKLRAEAEADGGGAALVALARFRIDADVSVIRDALGRKVENLTDYNDALLAAELFPDPRLLPGLRAVGQFAQAWLRRDVPLRAGFWATAVTAQGSEEAAGLLVEFWRDAAGLREDKRSGLAEVLRTAVRQHPAKAFAMLPAVIR